MYSIALQKMRAFRFHVTAIVIFSTAFALLILAVQWYGSGLEHQLLAYVQKGSIGLMDTDRRLSSWFSSNGLGLVVPQQLHWSPDGQALTFLINPETSIQAEIHILSTEDMSIRNVHIVSDGRSDTWSPDSQLFALTTATSHTEWELRVVDVATGNTLDYLTQPNGFEPVWSPNGQMIAFGSGNEMRVVDVKSGQLISDLTQPIYEQYPRFWRWSPDNRWLVFASFYEKDVYHITLSAIDLHTHQLRNLFSPVNFSTTPPIWSPDSQYMAFSTINIKGETGIDEIHILNVMTGQDIVLTPPGDSYFVRAWSSDGRQLLFFNNGAVYGISRSDDQPLLLIPVSYQPSSPIQLSRDGQQSTFIGMTSDSNIGTLFVLDMKTYIISQLAGNVSSAAWQP
jgi:dipeptidyl aminopeptidase/acylaminoacyl peptidase